MCDIVEERNCQARLEAQIAITMAIPHSPGQTNADIPQPPITVDAPCESETMRLGVVLLLSAALYTACVDVTPPWRGATALGGNPDAPAIGSSLGGVQGTIPEEMDAASGGVQAGGTTGTGPFATGGVAMPAGGGGAVGSTGAGGAISGTELDAASSDPPDVSMAAGGVVSSGGAVASSGGIPTQSGGVTAGGAVGKGGATGGTSATGGATPISCSSPVVPTNGNPPANGILTDFSHWDPAVRTWGRTDNVNGVLFRNAGNGGSIAEPTVEGSPRGLHLVGTLPPGGLAGGGLQFMVCATTASFTQIRFTYYGGGPGCGVDLLLHTFNQSTLAGGCAPTGTSTCHDFPRLAAVVNVSSTVVQPKQVTKLLSDFKRSAGATWSVTDARQVVGLEWRFTNGSTSTSCGADITVTDVAFLP